MDTQKRIKDFEPTTATLQKYRSPPFHQTIINQDTHGLDALRELLELLFPLRAKDGVAEHLGSGESEIGTKVRLD